MTINRREFLKGLGTLAAGASIATIGAYEYSYIESQAVVVERVQIPLRNLRSSLEGFKIVQLSDIHLHPYTQIGLVQEVVTIANTLKPDVVVLTGDYVLQSAGSIFELAPALAALNAKYGVFAVLGNHDLWTNEEIVQLGFAEARLPVLHNKGLALGVGQETIYLAGLDDGWSGKPDLNAALDNLPANTPAILLAHEPDLADTFSQDGRVSLQLSGHTHGGQVRLPGVGAPYAPVMGRKYVQGLFNVNDMWLYTNRGIGLVLPFRINCPPEITEITLVGI